MGTPSIPGSGFNPTTVSPQGGFQGYGMPSVPGSGGSTNLNQGWQSIINASGGGGNPPTAYGNSLIGPYNSGIWKDLWKSMSELYGGHGMGNVMANYVTSGAGFNPQMLQSLFATMDPTISKSLATIDAGSGASGTRFGSAHDFADSNYLSQVYADQGQLAFNEYDQAQNRIMDILGGAAKTAAATSPGPGLMQSIMGGLSTAGGVASAGLTAAGITSGGASDIAAALMFL